MTHALLSKGFSQKFFFESKNKWDNEQESNYEEYGILLPLFSVLLCKSKKWEIKIKTWNIVVKEKSLSISDFSWVIQECDI